MTAPGRNLRFALAMSAFATVAVAQQAPPLPRPGDPVARGAYLAAAAGCVSCHTADDGAPFAGGLDIGTRFGVLRSANITPDPETGIGAWSRDDFQRALRDGLRKDGQPLYPAMPYDHYTKIDDADIDALWSYFQTVTPVRNAVVVDDLAFPYNVRAGMTVWQELFFQPGRFVPDPNRDAEFNRGAYLVEALGHCGACHSPRNALGAEDGGRALTGGVVAPWYAPNISNDAASVLDDYSVDSLAQYLSGGYDGHNRTPVGPMAEVVLNSLSKLRPADVRAIAVYLKTRAAPAPTAQSAGAPASAPVSASSAAGAGVYGSNCVTCHGPAGAGVDGIAARLAGSGSVADGPPDNAIAVLLEGIAPRGEWGFMPSFAAALTDQEIADVVNYVRGSWGNAATIAATPEQVAGARRMIASPAARVVDATLCPAVPADHLDDATLGALAALGTDLPTAPRLGPLVAAYDQAFAQLPRSERITALTGAYCRGLAERLPDHDAVTERELAFMNLVGDLVAD